MAHPHGWVPATVAAYDVRDRPRESGEAQCASRPSELATRSPVAARGHAPAARWRRRGPRRPPHRRSARNRGPRWSDNGSRYYQIRNTYDADLHIRAPPGGGGVPINDIDNPPPPRRPPPVRRYITYYQKLNPGIVNLRRADRAARHERAVAPPSRPRCGTVPNPERRNYHSRPRRHTPCPRLYVIRSFFTRSAGVCSYLV